MTNLNTNPAEGGPLPMNDEHEQDGGVCVGCNEATVINAADLCRRCAALTCRRCGGTNVSPDHPGLGCCACAARRDGAPDRIVERLEEPWVLTFTHAGTTSPVGRLCRSSRKAAEAKASNMRRHGFDVRVSYLSTVGRWTGVVTMTAAEQAAARDRGDTIGD